MKRVYGFLVVLALIGLLVGCDQTTKLTYDDIKGTWVFPDQGGYTDISLYISDMIEGAADLGWHTSEYSFFCWGDGTFADNKITGTYSYNQSVLETSAEVDSGTDQAITITFTLSKGKLSISCSGSGPANGKTFTQGAYQIAN